MTRFDLNEKETILLNKLIRAMEDNPKYFSTRGVYYRTPHIDPQTNIERIGMACLLGTGLLYAGISAEVWHRTARDAPEVFAEQFDVTVTFARGAEAGFEDWQQHDIDPEALGLDLREFYAGYRLGQAFYAEMASRGRVHDRNGAVR